MKICNRCKEEKELLEFGKKGSQYQPFCKECNKLYLKEHYKNNKQDYINKNSNRKKDLQNFINTIKTSKGCSYCGETDFACLDFHHMGEKESEIARAIHNGWSKERLLKEINKCIVICSNCHRKLHYYGSVV